MSDREHIELIQPSLRDGPPAARLNLALKDEASAYLANREIVANTYKRVDALPW